MKSFIKTPLIIALASASIFIANVSQANGGWTACYGIHSFKIDSTTNRIHVKPQGEVTGYSGCPRTDIGSEVWMSTPPENVLSTQQFIKVTATVTDAFFRGLSIKHRTECIDNHSQYIHEVKIC
ncbi:MAG: hypothetical protein HZT40_15765 [Candidatus Thiothrix singaporensis]|uniref:Secreted protein n=1 Tax=Candidatus Thiothrix singaporensis TaxID=2799669 RepID=A0A7L6AUM3_9GAMM|nr:MAG: hypothetical protein HZT40_15765 [Candidatus Thiothrix singaporensis]